MELVYPKQTATEDFLDCWRSAGLHFNSMKSEYALRYVDGPLCLPLLAHLTFILGNQLFDPKVLLKNHCTHVFMAEDFGLCTHHNYHKLKLFLSKISKI